MTIRTENMTVRDPMTIKINKRDKPVWCTDNGKHWNSATECAKEMGVHPTMLYGVLNGKYKTCKGLHFSYDEDVTKAKTMMAQRISDTSKEIEQLKAENERLKADAEFGRAVRKEQEERLQAMVKAREKVERRQRIRDNAYQKAQLAAERLAEAKRELDELQNK